MSISYSLETNAEMGWEYIPVNFLRQVSPNKESNQNPVVIVSRIYQIKEMDLRNSMGRL